MNWEFISGMLAGATVTLAILAVTALLSTDPNQRFKEYTIDMCIEKRATNACKVLVNKGE